MLHLGSLSDAAHTAPRTGSMLPWPHAVRSALLVMAAAQSAVCATAALILLTLGAEAPSALSRCHVRTGQYFHWEPPPAHHEERPVLAGRGLLVIGERGSRPLLCSPTHRCRSTAFWRCADQLPRSPTCRVSQHIGESSGKWTGWPAQMQSYWHSMAGMLCRQSGGGSRG